MKFNKKEMIKYIWSFSLCAYTSDGHVFFIIYMKFISKHFHQQGRVPIQRLSLSDASRRKHRRQEEKWKMLWRRVLMNYTLFCSFCMKIHTRCDAARKFWSTVPRHASPLFALRSHTSIWALDRIHILMHMQPRLFTQCISKCICATAALHLPPFNFILISGQMKM